MSAYTLEQERAIRASRLVSDWTRSGLLTPEQQAQMKPGLAVDLRRTNLFLRITLFVFGLMIVQAAVGFLTLIIGGFDPTSSGVLWTVAGMASCAFAVFVVDRYRLYRFGVEEAAAVAAIGLVAAGVAVVVSAATPGTSQGTFVAGTLAGGAAALGVFLQFGYRYAALAAMVFACALPFWLGSSEAVERVVSAVLLAGVAVFWRAKRSDHGDDFPGDTYGFLEAAAWVGIYLLINLQISAGITGIDSSETFYWITYGAIWLLPVLALWLAIRGRHRALLDAGLAMALATFMSNKPYLHGQPNAWDPIVFGVFLMVGAIGVRRWLAAGAGGTRDGFTATRVLASDKAKVGIVGMASVAHPGAAPASPASAAPDTIGGGGRSGGAGSSGSF